MSCGEFSMSALKATELSFSSCSALHLILFYIFSSSVKAKCIFLFMEERGANTAWQKSGEGNAVFHTLETEDGKKFVAF